MPPYTRIGECNFLSSKNEEIYSHWDFPGGPTVNNLPSDARDAGSIPGWGTNSPCTTEQLSLHTATAEPVCSESNPDFQREVPQPQCSTDTAVSNPQATSFPANPAGFLVPQTCRSTVNG